MKTIKIQENELNEARDLQKKCVDLHLPVPPVVSWNATITDKNGVEREQTIAKANSYVRNALNVLAHYIGMASETVVGSLYFKDGYLSIKDSSGRMNAANISPSTSNQFHLTLGDQLNPSPETLDHYELPVLKGSWNAAGSLRYSDFDDSSRKLITQFVIVYVNNSPNTQYISEAAVYHQSSSYAYLMLRDVFTPIAVGAGETIRFVYQTEVLFPES